MKLLRRSRSLRPPTLLPGRGPRLRLGTWPTDPEVGHLVVLEHEHVPSTAELGRIVDDARARHLHSIRTGALFPDAAAVLLDMGFTRIDSLMLLRLDLDEGHESDPEANGHDPDPHQTHPPAPHDDPRAVATAPVRTHRLRLSDDEAAAEVDRLAFGPLWGYDRRTVTEVRRATPAHRARRIGGPRRLDAYAISGAGGTTGYLQRLAVRPDRRRCGLASALVADSLHWMRSRGLGSALVNTATDNDAALALYGRFGFRPLSDRLTVAEFALDAGAPHPVT